MGVRAVLEQLLRQRNMLDFDDLLLVRGFDWHRHIDIHKKHNDASFGKASNVAAGHTVAQTRVLIQSYPFCV